MKHLDLFSGIGGFALAARWAGIETVAFCEKDTFCQNVLKKHWPDVPIHNDIKDFDGTQFTGIDLLTGGYPCQPFSTAGKRKGANDPRHLWPEMFRVIQQAKPTWVLCENVEGHIANGLDSVCDDLESAEYEVQPLVIPACAVESPHIRTRVWIIANSISNGGQRIMEVSRKAEATNAGQWGQQDGELIQTDPRSAKTGWRNGWGFAPRVCRVDDGIPNRVDRVKSLGNSIVPQVAYEILRAIRAV
jgi:DNA (cytosine-5)-methyltransferase 1